MDKMPTAIHHLVDVNIQNGLSIFSLSTIPAKSIDGLKSFWSQPYFCTIPASLNHCRTRCLSSHILFSLPPSISYSSFLTPYFFLIVLSPERPRLISSLALPLHLIFPYFHLRSTLSLDSTLSSLKLFAILIEATRRPRLSFTALTLKILAILAEVHTVLVEDSRDPC